MKEGRFHPLKSYMVAAPAGSGKTEALTERFVSLLAQMDPPNPRRILAVTYTNEAAAEMRARIIQKIRQEYPELYKKIRRDLAHLRVQTFHSLGRRLIQHFALEMGFDPQLGVLTYAEGMFQEFLNHILLRAQEGDEELHELLLQNVTKKISSLKMELVNLLRLRPRWEFLENPEDPEIQARIALYPLFRKLLQEFQKEKQRLGLIDFADMEFLAHRLLYREGNGDQNQEPLWPQILEAFDEATDHLLVDEFQDTNLLQWSILSKLTEEWRAGKGAKEEKGVTPTFFIVGDEQQSIYGFRGANVEVFRQVREELASYLGPNRFEVVYKRENYRSLQAIIDFINRIFPRIFQAEESPDPWKTVYQPFARQRPIEDPGAVHLVFAELENDAVSRVNQRRQLEAEIFARWILELMEHGWVYEDHTRRRPEFRDFAILLKTRVEEKIYTRVFQAYEIPFLMDRSKRYFQAEEIQILLTLVRYLAYGESAKFSLYQILNSPLFGDLPPEERARIFDDVPLSSENHPFSKWVRQRDSRPLSEVLEEILLARDFWKTLTSPQSLANVEKFLSWIGQLDGEGKSWREIAEILHQKESQGMEAAKLIDPDMNVVRITTIHGAKGLQWPIVFVGTLSWDVSSKGNILFQESLDPREGYRTTLMEDALAKEKRIEEQKRLLYVAMTRARDLLLLPIPLGTSRNLRSNVSQFILQALGMDRGMTWDEIQDLAPSIPGVFLHRWAEIQSKPAPAPSPEKEPPPPPSLIHPDPLPIQSTPPVIPMAKDVHGGDPEWSLFGTLFHEIVLRVIQRKLPNDENALRPEVEELFRNRVLSQKRREDYEKAFWKHWHNLQQIEALRLLLHQQVPPASVRTEFPLIRKEGETAYVGRADVVWFREEDLWVIDFKTAPVNGPLEALVQRYRPQLEHYRKALHLLYGKPVRAFLAFSDTGDWAEI